MFESQSLILINLVNHPRTPEPVTPFISTFKHTCVDPFSIMFPNTPQMAGEFIEENKN